MKSRHERTFEFKSSLGYVSQQKEDGTFREWSKINHNRFNGCKQYEKMELPNSKLYFSIEWNRMKQNGMEWRSVYKSTTCTSKSPSYWTTVQPFIIKVWTCLASSGAWCVYFRFFSVGSHTFMLFLFGPLKQCKATFQLEYTQNWPVTEHIMFTTVYTQNVLDTHFSLFCWRKKNSISVSKLFHFSLYFNEHTHTHAMSLLLLILRFAYFFGDFSKVQYRFIVA